MIHRQNYQDVHAYLHYMEQRQLEPSTIKRARGHLRHLLQWADETPFSKSRSIDPAFPSYLTTIKASSPSGEVGRGLAPASIVKCLANARQFFEFAHSEWTLRYKTITTSWIDLLQPPRLMRAESRLATRQYWALDDVKKIAAVAVETLHEERGQVAVCMLYLSGMRAEALATLPIHCVDLSANQIKQLPEYGVRTKNKKAALTYLIPIPELLEVVTRWDQRARAQLSPESLWYATLTSDGMKISSTIRAFDKRHNTVEKDVRLICQRANVPYLSPHKLRHGHAVYGLKNARTIEELKAVSQNIMHASMTITDGIYANLLTNEVQSIITNLGKIMPLQQNNETADLSRKITELLDLLKPK